MDPVFQHALLIGGGSVAATMLMPYLAARFLPPRWRVPVRFHAKMDMMGGLAVAVIALVSPTLLTLA